MAQNTATSSTDLLIRFLHIVIILSFTGAYLTGDAEEWHQVHFEESEELSLLAQGKEQLKYPSTGSGV